MTVCVELCYVSSSCGKKKRESGRKKVCVQKVEGDGLERLKRW